MINKDNADLVTEKIDWLGEKKGSQLVLAFLLLIVIILSGLLIRAQNKDNERYEDLNSKLKEFEKVRDDNLLLRAEIAEAKLNNVMINAASDYNPIPMWLTDRKGTIIWINKAYVRKYLTPYGYSLSDILGTKGEGVFGEDNSLKFIKNNNLVLDKNIPITFEELEKTTKFPVKVGDYVFAVGGLEYEYFPLPEDTKNNKSKKIKVKKIS